MTTTPCLDCGAPAPYSEAGVSLCTPCESDRDDSASIGPACGHSACSQNYIDTGERDCVYVATYTTAPEGYDWMGTEPGAVVGTDRRGKPIRRVLSLPCYVDGQRDRYGSGLHMAVDDAEWAKLVGYKLVTVTTSSADVVDGSAATRSALRVEAKRTARARGRGAK